MATESEIIDDIFANMSKNLNYKVHPQQTDRLIKLDLERELAQARAFTFRFGLLKGKTLGEVVDDQLMWGALNRVKKTTKSEALKSKITLAAQAKIKGY
jgi:hypothetical protein